MRTLTEIIQDRFNTNHNRALECLVALDEMTSDDLARPDFRAASQTFALLAIRDELMQGTTGRNVAEIIALGLDAEPTTL